MKSILARLQRDTRSMQLAAAEPADTTEGLAAAADVKNESVSRSLLFQPASEYIVRSYGRDPRSLPNGKIVVFGLPKSGNVWLVSLLAHYTGLPPCHPIQDRDKPGVGMCHYPVTGEIAFRDDFVLGVYLVRDIRDVIVSYFHNGQTAWFRDDMPNFHYDDIEEFYFEWFLPRVVPYHHIMDHAEGFMTVGMPILRYEKLCADTVREFGRLVKRIGLPFNADRVAKSVEANAINKLKKSGVTLDRFVPPTHFRKGGHGSYKTEMPPSVLKHVQEQFGTMLERWGYQLD